MAERADCHPETIWKRLGQELPAGRRLTQPRGMWGFTPAEAKAIVAWAQKHRRGRQGRRPGT